MHVRALEPSDQSALEAYLASHKDACMFICSNLKAAGIHDTGKDYEGAYYGSFEEAPAGAQRLCGVIVHYWNGNIMVHALSDGVRAHLVSHLKTHLSRPVQGVLGLSQQAAHVISALGLEGASFKINRDEGLFALSLDALGPLTLVPHMDVVSAKDTQEDVLLAWLKAYQMEALGAKDDAHLALAAQGQLDRLLQTKDAWVLLQGGVPLALVGFNARLEDMVQVGPVWTPPEHRSQGFARRLLAHVLRLERPKGARRAVLFTDHPAAIKAYLAVGFERIGNYRLALLEKPLRL